uniref:Uncharacterized protein n=1 Tax=Sphaerodactylus townsendi TaxID=933632 RepID=A0ACB8FYH7_9SAUR
MKTEIVLSWLIITSLLIVFKLQRKISIRKSFLAGLDQVPGMASKGAAASASTENSNTGGTSGNSSNGDSASQDSTFECNICLDTAKDAVISLCGHLFWFVVFMSDCTP